MGYCKTGFIIDENFTISSIDILQQRGHHAERAPLGYDDELIVSEANDRELYVITHDKGMKGENVIHVPEGSDEKVIRILSKKRFYKPKHMDCLK